MRIPFLIKDLYDRHVKKGAYHIRITKPCQLFFRHIENIEKDEEILEITEKYISEIDSIIKQSDFSQTSDTH